ncbi:MAG TPA: restriction endonuclease subunit S [Prolixibacteraceae bacterium]|nr:restriction endonuclease subunit S [Prolixibacteraceae bacterium]
MKIIRTQKNSRTGNNHSIFESIPSDWEVKRLVEICTDFKSGVGITSENISIIGKYPVYGGNGLRGFTEKYTHNGKYILIGRQGALCGNIIRVDGFLYISEHAIAVRTDVNNNLDYLAYTLDYKNLNKLSESSAQPGLSVEKLTKIKIPLPPLTEQKAIAKVLSTADAAIHTTEKLIAQKELRKKWLMQQLLTGKKRLKGFSGEWKEKKLGELFSQIRNVNDGCDGHSIMTISSKLGLISQEDKFDRVIAGDSLKKYTQLMKGDFAYNKGNSKTYPMGCIYRLEEKESALVPFVYICFKPSELIDGLFYKYWFLAHGLDNQLNKIITSGARGDGLLNVNTEDFFKIKVPYPQKEEQIAIAKVLHAADKEISLLKAKAEKLREQKKGLMQVLLTGKVRLKTNNE